MDAVGRRLGMRIAALGILFAAPGILLGQVTNGKAPQLPAPFATKSAGNPPEESKPPKGFLPTVPDGFKISVFATGFNEPRWLTVAPNGKDIFLADTHAGKIYILRMPASGDGEAQKEEFLTGLDEPFGIAFHDDYIYVGDTDAVLRYKFDPANSKKLGDKEKIMDLPRRGHSTRAVAFSPDGKHLFVSVGSQSNVDIESDTRRAAITICDLDGKNARLYATGTRNPVNIAFEPKTGVLYTSVNERDGLGDDLPPDYFTSVKDGGFYGWPYSYIGKNVDPRVNPQKPELVAKAIIPDVLLGAHRAPLQFAFYTGKQFPAKYDGGAFLCEHGSWNRSQRAGYQVVFIPFTDGKPSGDPQPFMTGLVPDATKGNVNGRPVGVTVAPDGSLLVSDDGAQVVYRISAK
ncbi:MAG TPA: sorbosone dehydrogenase family protein [Candidatus Acidoferrum sp.]